MDELGIRLSADGVVQTTNGLALTTKATTELGRAADAAAPKVAAVGTSAKATAAAMRQLPLQMQDVVVSLQAGQAPMQVLLQQGSQIVGSFGGVRATFSALASAAGPLGLAMGAVAAAAGVVYAAFSTGERQAKAMTQALLFTGQASGATAGQLGQTADALGAIAGRGAAVEVLAQVASSAAVSAQRMGEVAAAALQMERVAGRAAKDTVEEFIKLGREPVEASRKLNEATNFLTAAVYEQIRALAEQGRTTEAANLAQRAYADSVLQRTAQLQANLGLLERAWLGVRGAAVGAWDAMLGVGRADTTESRLASAQERLAKLRAGNVPGQGLGFSDQMRASRAREVAAAEAEVQALTRLAGADALRASEAGISASANRSAIAARDALAKADEAALTKAQQRARLWKQYQDQQREAAAAGLKVDADAARRYKAYLDEAFADPKGPRAGREKERQIIGSAPTLNEQFRRFELAGYEGTERELARQRLADMEAERKAREQASQLAEREAGTLRQQVQALEEETAAIGLSEQALLARKQAQVDATIAERQAQLARLEGLGGYEREAEALREQIELLQRLRGGLGERGAAQQRAEEQAENKRRRDSLAGAIEDGLLHGFDRGRGIADAFRRELVEMFARTYLRPKIEMVADAAGSLIGNIGSVLGNFLGSLFGFHSGGVGAGEASFTRVPKFHTGVGPGEMHAVIQKTEGVFTQGQMRAMAPLDEVQRAVGGGRQRPVVNYSPTINVDARSDRAAVVADIDRISRGHVAQLLDQMERGLV